MDFSKIFLKDACPTSIGGQAVMEGVMMRGPDRTAVSVRLPDGRIFVRTRKHGKSAKIYKIPLIRGIYSFISSLVLGTQILTYSADVLELYTPDDDEEAESRQERGEHAADADAGSDGGADAAGAGGSGKEQGRDKGEEKKGFLDRMVDRFGEQAVWNMMLAVSVVLALAFSIAIFMIMPTVVVSLLGKYIKNSFVLNLIEGIFRIALFILYIVLISRMEDIKRTFQYHGAEHKTIHCFENGLELTPENAQQFYRLHPRCGTSFLMFVMVISLILFSLVGWPTLWMRILYRLALLPVVAALSYEVLRWAGRSNNRIVEILSVPGLLLQKITTAEPDDSQLEIGIVSMKAVLVPPETPEIEGICDRDANLIEAVDIKEERRKAEEK
ncbi:MAG: DUF1385 domain-containing protein [Anaerovoracaceae bacterium]